MLCCPIYAVVSLFFRIKKQIDQECSVRFLKLADHSGGSIVLGEKVILQ